MLVINLFFIILGRIGVMVQCPGGLALGGISAGSDAGSYQVYKRKILGILGSGYLQMKLLDVEL